MSAPVSKLRFGVMCAGDRLESAFAASIDELLKIEGVELALLIVSAHPPARSSTWTKLKRMASLNGTLWAIFQRLFPPERLACYRPRDMSAVFAGVERIPCRVIRKGKFSEYFEPGDVERILETMRRLVRPHGRVLIAFGPPWLHPLGGHLFSVFPWAHLVFTERALLRWRADFKSDGATRFGEVEGGLNQMTVRRFRTLVDRCDFAVERFEAAPIKRLRRLSNALTLEFVTAMVRCELSPRPAAAERTP